MPLPAADTEHAFYRLGAYVVPDALASGWDRDRILRAISAEGVAVQYGSCAEIYREDAFVSAGSRPASRLPGAAEVHETCARVLRAPDPDATPTSTTRPPPSRKVMEVASR